MRVAILIVERGRVRLFGRRACPYLIGDIRQGPIHHSVIRRLVRGHALSVCAFGTGGKRKHIFRDIYFSVEDTDGIGVLYTKTGEYSAVLKIENPVQKYCADIDSYYEFTQLFTALAQTLGEGYALHKQDIFVRRRFAEETGGDREFLSEAYFRYFEGRPYTDSMCYLTVTQEAKKSRLFSYDGKKWRDFLVKIRKVHDQLRDGGVQARFLNKAEASEYVDRYFAMDFKNRIVSMTNFRADEDTVSMGGKRCKVYSLVDVDYAALPSLIRPYTNIEVNQHGDARWTSCRSSTTYRTPIRWCTTR